MSVAQPLPRGLFWKLPPLALPRLLVRGFFFGATKGHSTFFGIVFAVRLLHEAFGSRATSQRNCCYALSLR